MSTSNWVEVVCIGLLFILGGIILYYSKKKIQEYEGLGTIEKKGNEKGKFVGKL